jgi:hypothetical protein
MTPPKSSDCNPDAPASFAAPPGSDAAVIVAEGYYRLKAERDELLKIVDDLYRLIINHHSSVVMREDIVICPACTNRSGKRIMDRAYRALHPNGKVSR